MRAMTVLPGQKGTAGLAEIMVLRFTSWTKALGRPPGDLKVVVDFTS